MARFNTTQQTSISLILAAVLLSSCGGGGDTTANASTQGPALTNATPASTASQSGTDTTAGSRQGSTTSLASKTFSDSLLTAINATRATARNCGTTAFPAAPPVEWNSLAETAALAQAQYLQENNLFSHTGANGSNVGDRLTTTGYVWSTVGENIAAGYTQVPAVVQAWIDSPGHCANLMNTNFIDMGVALVPGSSANKYQTYWGMVLAKPR